MKKKGFTLSELLVVVVIIGVLSAVVLPKFSKVIETRKTTEAEELMSAVRTEQEARCTLSKKYADVSTLGSYRAGKNFSYGNEDKNLGMIATASNNKYKLEMPSYADGRICCSDIETGACNNLNKSYPLCSELKGYSDYKEASEDCGIEIEEGKETPTEPEEEECVSGTTEERSCSNNCGETGTQKNQCIGGKWQGWGACSVSDKTSCGGGTVCDPGQKEVSSCTCGVEQGRVCKADGSGWDTYNNGSCELSNAEKVSCSCVEQPASESRDCKEGTGTQTMDYVCKNGAWVAGEWKGECHVCTPSASYTEVSHAYAHGVAPNLHNLCMDNWQSRTTPYTCTNVTAETTCTDFYLKEKGISRNYVDISGKGLTAGIQSGGGCSPSHWNDQLNIEGLSDMANWKSVKNASDAQAACNKATTVGTFGYYTCSVTKPNTGNVHYDNNGINWSGTTYAIGYCIVKENNKYMKATVTCCPQ